MENILNVNVQVTFGLSHRTNEIFILEITQTLLITSLFRKHNIHLAYISVEVMRNTRVLFNNNGKFPEGRIQH